MKKQVQNSLERIKFLNEFHFKSHNRADSVVNDEQPVKFNEVGDTYKHQEEENDYPTFEQYRDDVMIDEEDPTPEQQPQGGAPAPEQPAPAPQGGDAPVPAGQDPPAPAAPMPDASAAPAPAPMPEPAPAPAPVAPPMPAPAPEPVDPMMGTLAAQIAKTDELLAKFDNFQTKLAGMETVSLKLDDVEKKLEDLKNPPYEDQLEMISKQAYPYNITLSDFWGWDKDDESAEEPEQEFKLTPDEVNNYNKDDIKKSFNV